jgi:hypothetical protein
VLFTYQVLAGLFALLVVHLIPVVALHILKVDKLMATACVSNVTSEERVNSHNAISSRNWTLAQPPTNAPISTSSHYPRSDYPLNGNLNGTIITSLSDNSVIIGLLFSQKQSIEWEEFKTAAIYHFRARDEDLDQLKNVLGAQHGNVTADQFAKLLRWFTPLVPEQENNNTMAVRSSFVWRISSVARLISQPWFHGFAVNTPQRLKPCEHGTFLVRFGTQAPHFSLALKDRSTDTVVEWRVLASSGTVRLIENERFTDLFYLVDNYSRVVPLGASCLLHQPCPK